MGIFKKRVNDFPTPYTCTRAIREGGLETKLSMVLMGFGNIVHGQKIKGLLYLAVEVAYVVFMVVNGIGFLGMLGSLGTVPQEEYWDETLQVYMYTKGDQSVLILLYGVATVLLLVAIGFCLVLSSAAEPYFQGFCGIDVFIWERLNSSIYAEMV